MKSAPPPKYVDLASTVENYLTKAAELQGWSIDAIEDPVQDKPQVFPFAKDGAVGAHVIYNDSKSGVTVHADVSSHMTSWKDLLPLVTYTKAVEGKSLTAEYNFRSNCLRQTYASPTFCLTSKTCVADGLSSIFSGTTRIFEKAFVGLCTHYDPKRSGLKDLVLTAVRYECPNVGGGDLLARYSLERGFGLHVRVPIHTYMDAAVIAEKRRFIAGVQGRSPCGARVMVSTNVNDGTVTATAIRNLNDIWKLSVTYTTGALGNRGSNCLPRFGLKFSNDSMLD